MISSTLVVSSWIGFSHGWISLGLNDRESVVSFLRSEKSFLHFLTVSTRIQLMMLGGNLIEFKAHLAEQRAFLQDRSIF